MILYFNIPRLYLKLADIYIGLYTPKPQPTHNQQPQQNLIHSYNQFSPVMAFVWTLGHYHVDPRTLPYGPSDTNTWTLGHYHMDPRTLSIRPSFPRALSESAGSYLNKTNAAVDSQKCHKAAQLL